MINYLKNKYAGIYYPGKGREAVKKEYKVTARPVDKRENYVKRCIAVPGDVIEVINGQLYVNEKPAENPARMQYSYFVTDSTGIGLTLKKRKALNINEEDIMKYNSITTKYWLTNEQKIPNRKNGNDGRKSH